MADAAEILVVRELTNEPTQDPYTDVMVGLLIDTLTNVNLAASAVWDRKAAKYAELVDVSEAGASRKMSDLFNHAKERAAYFRAIGNEEIGVIAGKGRVKVHLIERIN